MKKLLQISFVISLLLMLSALGASAQMPALGGVEGMRGSADLDDHTAQEETEGKAIWQKLQAKETECAALSDEDFERLGEYFMGQMMGDAHPAMNAMMERMLGEEGEEGVLHHGQPVVFGSEIDGVVEIERARCSLFQTVRFLRRAIAGFRIVCAGGTKEEK